MGAGCVKIGVEIALQNGRIRILNGIFIGLKLFLFAGFGIEVPKSGTDDGCYDETDNQDRPVVLPRGCGNGLQRLCFGPLSGNRWWCLLMLPVTHCVVLAVRTCALLLEINFATLWTSGDFTCNLNATLWAYWGFVADLVSTFGTFYYCHIVCFLVSEFDFTKRMSAHEPAFVNISVDTVDAPFTRVLPHCDVAIIF